MANNTYNDVATQFYFSYFGRPADYIGFENMKAALAAASAPTTAQALLNAYSTNATVKSLVDSFGNSAESAALYPGATTEFVTAVYNNVLGRAPDAAGLVYWATEIDAGRLVKGKVALAIAAAASASTADALTVTTKTAAANAFTALFADGTNDVNQLNAYNGSNAAATARTWLGTVTGATTSAQYNASAATAIDNIVAGVTGATGETKTLTAAADLFTTGGGNDTFVATNATLSAADKLNGGASNADVLKYSSGATAAFGAFEMSNVETFQVTQDTAATLATFDVSGTTGARTFETLNSVGSVEWDYITELQSAATTALPATNLLITNITNNSNTTAYFQTTAVAGAADSVGVNLTSNANANAGVITIGQIDGTGVKAATGIETVNMNVAGNGHTVGQLNTNLTTLNITGNQNLTITTALNGTERTINAGTFSGALNLRSTATGAANVSIAGGTGADTITYDGTTGNHTVTLGTGNDTLTVGSGDDSIQLGAGNDTMILDANDLTVADTIHGDTAGTAADTGYDTFTFTAADNISKSEAEKVTAVELFNLAGAAGTLVVTDNLVTTANASTTTGTLGALAGGMTGFTVNTTATTGVTPATVNSTTADTSTLIDITNVTFSNTNKFQLIGGANSETVLANDATVNAKAGLAFGTGTDTLRIRDGGNFTADDFQYVTGLDIIRLESALNVGQTWNVQANANLNNVVIRADDEIPAGSVLNITSAAGVAITVYRNANLKVFVDGVEQAGPYTTTSGVTVNPILHYTTTTDTLTTMTGTAGADVFIADFLNEVNTADSIDGGALTDTLLLNFALSNVNCSVAAQLNNTSITAVETLTFNTNDAIAFTTDGYASIVTVNTGTGNDTISGNNEAGTYNLGAGNNSYTNLTGTGLANAETVTTGAGNDAFNFVSDANATTLTAIDSIAASTGTDTLTIGDGPGAGAVFALPNVITGIDVINYTTGHAGDGLLVDQTDVNVADDAETDFNVTDGTAAANTVAIFDASALTAGNANPYTAKVVVSAGAAGNLGLATNAADVIGGADTDTITLGATLGGAGGGYVVRGNAGADLIDIGANATGVIVNINSSNDGGTTNAQTGYDTIRGFTSGTDVFGFTQANIGTVLNQLAVHGAVAGNAKAGNAALGGGAATAGSFLVSTDAAVSFTDGAATQDALVLTQLANGVTDAQLTDLNFIATKANTHGVTAAATDGGIIVVQGATNSAIYLYVEDATLVNNVSAAELKILAIVEGAAVVGTDLWSI